MAGRHITETARLVLREFDEADVEAFFALGSDPAIIRFTGDPGGGLKSLEQALETLRTRPLADYRKYGYGRWACVEKTSGAVIGFAGVKFLEDLGEVDLGYRLLPSHWGQGLATEASRAVLDSARRTFGLSQVIGLIDPENVASRRVLEKLEFTFAEMMEYHGAATAKYVRALR